MYNIKSIDSLIQLMKMNKYFADETDLYCANNENRNKYNAINWNVKEKIEFFFSYHWSNRCCHDEIRKRLWDLLHFQLWNINFRNILLDVLVCYELTTCHSQWSNRVFLFHAPEKCDSTWMWIHVSARFECKFYVFNSNFTHKIQRLVQLITINS